MNAGNRVAVSLNIPGSAVGHSEVLSGVYQKAITRINGTSIVRSIYRFMNPATGATHFLSGSGFSGLHVPGGVNIFFIR